MDFKLDLYAIPILKSRSTLQFGGYLLITYRSTSVHSSTTSEMIREVPVTVVIEPCWVGGIPESLLATLGIVIILAGGLVVLRIPQKITEMLRGLRDLQKNEKQDWGKRGDFVLRLESLRTKRKDWLQLVLNKTKQNKRKVTDCTIGRSEKRFSVSRESREVREEEARETTEEKICERQGATVLEIVPVEERGKQQMSCFIDPISWRP